MAKRGKNYISIMHSLGRLVALCTIASVVAVGSVNAAEAGRAKRVLMISTGSRLSPGFGLVEQTAASSIVAVHQKDAKRFKVIFPFGPLKKDEMSFAPPKPQTDPENNMIWSADFGVGKVAGIKFDPATGDMKTAYVLDITTTGFQPLYGPKDKRVVVLSNMKRNVAAEPMVAAMWTGNYTEQITWHDAATGRTLAESDFFEPMTFNGLIIPGYGGRVYYTTSKGFITLQVMPKRAAPSSK
jgi:hypothetical protein